MLVAGPLDLKSEGAFLHRVTSAMDLRRFRLRTITLQSGDEIKSHDDVGMIESEGPLKDWLIVTYPFEKYPPRQIAVLRRMLIESFGEKVMVIPDDIKFYAFEEVLDQFEETIVSEEEKQDA